MAQLMLSAKKTDFIDIGWTLYMAPEDNRHVRTSATANGKWQLMKSRDLVESF
ncbi:hypothetical protein RHIZ_10530 [Rhizobium skierniewicense]|uniref:hypothetical protein n=1 Tax=Rhizobium TaxID=379 RepID=UPI001FAC4B56|nr:MULTISPECIES: hypothetical protein [Rhizobium]MCI9866379.1 hypothetical protein [Rhizobium skierniewicense]